MELPPYVHPASGGTRVDIFVQPRAARECLAGIHDGAVKLKVRAPAQDGKANRAVLDFVAGILDLPRARVRMTSGDASRHKRIFISGLPPKAVAERFNDALPS